MPNIEISKKDFESLLGKKLSSKELEEVFEFTKVEINKIEDDKITLEVKDTNRQDLLSVEGIARELKGVLEKETGLANYKVEKSEFVVRVDKKVKEVRPFTVCAVVKDLKFDDAFIEQIVQLQEKLCESIGKKRKEVALGVYDFDKIKWPITYTTYKPDSLSFVPLGFIEKMTLKEILDKHEKGQAYKHLLQDAKEYPIFIDAAENVLSMPPIINSEYSGKVSKETKNVFIEVSGFNLEKLHHVLNIFVSALADRGGKIFQVSIHDSGKNITPKFFSRIKKLNLQEINSLLGIELKEKQIISLLRRARYDVKVKGKETNKEFIVDIPFYRADVLHPVDMIEDIAIVYGYKNFEPKELKIATNGKILDEQIFFESLSDLMTGLGFQEILTMDLSNKEMQFDLMNLQSKEHAGIIEIKNPISENQNCMRNLLLPSLLGFLGQNTTKLMPQKIFEIGKTFEIDEKKENKTQERDKLCITITHAKANFTEAKQILDYVINSTGKKYSLKPCQHNSFISGRAAEILVQDKKIGIIGEMHPKVLGNWKLKMPVSALEIDFDALK
jgi:phenylalanyl-tRNA synthetase beta chain